MSGSDHLTAAYLSKESSFKTLSVTLLDGVSGVGHTPCSTARDGSDALVRSGGGGAAVSPTVAASAQLKPILSHTIEGEEAQFIESSSDTPPPAGASASPAVVVNRAELSTAELSQMRLGGCRTHRLSPNASYVGSVYETGSVQTAGSPFVTLQRHSSAASSRYGDRLAGSHRVSAVSAASERSLQPRSGAVSPATTALDTSIAILHRMASETAARVEAARGGLTPTDVPSTGTAPSFFPSPPTLPTTQRTAVPATEECVDENATDPIGLVPLDGGAEDGISRPVSQLNTGSTRPYRRSSASSTSPLHSLSESELCGAQVRPLGASRNVSAQALAQLEEGGDGASAEAGSSGSGATQSSHAARPVDGADGARRRLRLTGASAFAHAFGDAAAAATGESASGAGRGSGARLSSPTGAVESPQQAIDFTVYNHDFQRIISHEVKEALTRNMRPSVDDDDDEEEALLNDVLSGQASPALVPVLRRGSVSMGESRNCAFAPFQLPMGFTSIGRLDSIVGTPSTDPTSRALCAPHDTPATRQPLSLSTAALEGDALASSGATTASASRGGKGCNPHPVSAQAWRFPSLGNGSTPVSPAMRRASLEDPQQPQQQQQRQQEGTDAAAATATTATMPGASSDSSSDPQAERATTPSPASWRRRRSSEESNATAAAAARVRSGLAGEEKPPAVAAAAAAAGVAAQVSVASATSPSSSSYGVGGGGAAAAKGMSFLTASGAPDLRPDRSVGVTSMVRFEGGRLYTQPQVSTHSSSSLPNSGGVLDDSYPRKLEMLYTVYERLVQQQRIAPTPKAMRTLVAKKPSRATTINAAAPHAAHNFLITPRAGQLAQQQHQHQQRGTPSAVIAVAETTPSCGVSSQVRRSPSLSYSGALGRSAGYYSFGTRVSLSHPNRQALPQQYLGSCSALMHATPSSRTTVLGSPAVVDLVVGGSQGTSGSGSAADQGAPESSLTHTTLSAARVARRSFNSVLVQRIEARPLLQCTLFLKHTLRSIREAHGEKARPADTSKESITTSQLALSGATVVPSHPHHVTRLSGATTPNAAATAAARALGREYMAAMATSVGSATNAASDDQDLSSRNMRGPSSGSSGSSIAEKAAEGSLKGGAGTAEAARQRQASLSEAAAAVTVHVDPAAGAEVGAAAADTAAPPTTSDTTPLNREEAHNTVTDNNTTNGVGGGNTAQRYFRALTEAGQRVRHVHGVDGVEREVDNESLDLIVYVGMRLLGWLEVVSLLGCGSFGQVFLCKDLRICDGHFVHPGEIGGVDYEYWNCSHAFLPFSSVDIAPTNPPLVAVKVVKSVPLLEQQSVLEAEMLVLIGAQTSPSADAAAAAGGGGSVPVSESVSSAPPPEDPRCASVAKVLADGICYGHHCIVMERYGANLYEYIASNEHLGLPMYQIRSIGAQLFSALSLIHEECHIIHADIKPENMLLTLNSSRGVVRTQEPPQQQPAPHAATAAAAATTSSTVARSPEARELSPASQQPRQVHRSEDTSTHSPERSYITLRSGPNVAGRHRHGQLSRRSSAVPLDASTSAMGRSKGQSFCHLRSSISNCVTMVEQTSVPAPEPRRVQSLNQSAGMLSTRAAASSLQAPALAGKAASSAPPPTSSMIPRLHVKLIDFSSSCYDGGPFYQYIQSRYYRAPEVVVGASYNSGIDIWSSGCLLAELLLGMPLLPGCNDHHQLCLIEEMVGPLPATVVQQGENMELYYQRVRPGDDAAAAPTSPAQSAAGAAAPPQSTPPPPPPRPFALRTREDYLRITQGEPLPYRRYFTYQTLQELVRHCPLTLEERRMSNGLQPYVPANESAEIPANATPSPSVRSEMMKQRFLLFDLLRRLLQTDPKQRPTASQALTHPFFTSAPPYMKAFMLE